MTAPELPDDLSDVVRHLEAAYPDEGCGMIVCGPGGWRVRPMENAWDRYHRMAPSQYPGSARTAYLFDPKEQLQALAELDARSEELTCIFHSHVDTGAYFSPLDRAQAAPFGEPFFPKASWLVVAVEGGGATSARVFWWKDGDFAEAPVDLGGRVGSRRDV
ncbi:MAG: M67 family metallopeptidase [Myxococcaceae bacterium]